MTEQNSNEHTLPSAGSLPESISRTPEDDIVCELPEYKLSERIPPRPPNARRVVINIIKIILALGIVACLTTAALIHLQHREETSVAQENAKSYTHHETITRPAPPYSTASALSSSVEAPDPIFLINADFDALHEKNTDVKAWVTIPGTGIDYPVMQAADNVFYMSRGLEKEPRSCGSAFLDCRIALDEDPLVYLIYGHGMSTRSDLMFSPLLNYMKQDFFVQHPDIYISLDTPLDGFESRSPDSNEYLFKVFAVCLVDAFSEESIARHYALTLGAETLSSYSDTQREYSIYDTGNYSAPSRVLALSTCAYPGTNNNTRLVVYAGLFPNIDT